MGGCFVFKQINTAKKKKVCFFLWGMIFNGYKLDGKTWFVVFIV